MQAIGLVKAFGARTLFEGLSFRVAPGERIAVVGRNGEGKTTLLRILAGELAPDAGTVAVAKGERVALHAQRPPLGRDLTLGDYVAEGMAGLHEAERRVSAFEARMAGGDHSDATLRDYQRATEDLERAGGYGWRTNMERVLRGLGISPGDLDRPLAGFSGGELTRASLARALVSRPTVLLLDEPTNHLDLEAVEWLEGAIQELAAAVVLVSHDRWFLESVATGVLEIEGGRARVWPGRYSAYRRQRAEALARQADLAERQAREIARLDRFVTRWRAGTKSRQAKSRARQVDRLRSAQAEPPSRRRSLQFGFPPTERTGRVVVEADGLGVAAGDLALVSGVGLTVERGQRIAVVGPNGAGKTSLVETLIGARAPVGGRVTLGHRVHVGYFSQHAADLDEDRTLVETVQRGTALTQTQARTLLGRFLFPGDIADRRVEGLSGGERRRLSLVRLIAEGGNLLVLDEPTNHLDVESREALEDALEAYDGTVVLVSHDRALIDVVATHTLAIEDGAAVLRFGGYGDLVAARAAEAPAPPAPPKARGKVKGPASPAPGGSGRPRDRRGPGPGREVRGIEHRIDALETELAAVEAALADPAVLADHARLAERGERHRAIQEELAWLLREWEERAGALER